MDELQSALLLSSVLALIGWLLLRRRTAGRLPGRAPVAATRSRAPEASQPPLDPPDLRRLAGINEMFSERLWRLAYGVPQSPLPLDQAHAEVRVAAVARLDPQKINPDYFPRRPALMQPLMQAVNDPNSGADKLARMIAHDPVISADVLRIANSALYRTRPEPIESIQRAIVNCGVESLKGILATAMVRPVFKANSHNFPRLPRLLWERTERAVRVAEIFAMRVQPSDRFESQLAVLLNALGPLVVYSACLDAYAKRPRLTPNPSLFVELTLTLGAPLSQRIAQEWNASPRLVAALARQSEEALSRPVAVGELVGTLGVLAGAGAVTGTEQRELTLLAGLNEAWLKELGFTGAERPVPEAHRRAG